VNDATRRNRTLGLVALGLFGLSLALPVVFQSGHAGGPCDDSLRGIDVLALGWLGPLGGQVGWFANPLIAWQVVRRLLGREPALWVAALCLALALTSFGWSSTPMDNGSLAICRREAGFYVWLAVPVVLLVAALADRFLPREGQART
jgi:hypothetical protein